MTLDLRHSFGGDSLPENFAGAFIERVNLPGVFRIVFDGSNIAVESETRFVFRGAGHGGGDENLVAPNDRAGMSESGHGSLPTQVVSFCAFQLTAAGWPSTTPDAPGPRNCGQFWAWMAAARTTKQRREKVDRFTGYTSVNLPKVVESRFGYAA